MNLYCFDFFGGYLGSMDEHGNVFDSRGYKWARVGESGEVCDLHGRPCGRIDLQGNFFTEQGVCRGYFRGWFEVSKRGFESGEAIRAGAPRTADRA